MANEDAKTQREKDKLSRFLANFTVEVDSKATDLLPHRRVFWNQTSESNSSSPELWLIHEKIKCAFCNVNAPRVKGLIQFWAVKTTQGGRMLLSTSDQPFSLEYLDPVFQKYRLFSMKYQYSIDDDDVEEVEREDPMIIPGGSPATAFLNRFPEVVMDLRPLRGNPLMDKALACGLTCLILVPVFHSSSQSSTPTTSPDSKCSCSSSSSCVGVVECCMKVSELLVVVNELKLALQSVGLSTYHGQESLPYILNCFSPAYNSEITHPVKPPTDEIQEALHIVCESHDISLAQVWIANESVNHPCPFMKNTRKKQLFLVKLSGFCSDLADDNIKAYYDTCDVLPLKTGKGLPGKTLETYQPLFCKNLCKHDLNDGLLGLLSGNTYCSCLVICLKSIHTGDVDYAFEFFWHRSRNYLIVLESLLSTLKRCLPSFKLSTGAQLGDEFHVVEVDNSTENEIGSFNIFQHNNVSPIPKALEEVWKGPKFVKRSLSDSLKINGETAYDFDSITSYWGYHDDIFVSAYCGREQTFFSFRCSYILENARESVEEGFNLKPGTYTMEFELEGNRVKLDTDDDLAHCIKLWVSVQKISGKKIRFLINVLQQCIDQHFQQLSFRSNNSLRC